MPSRQSSGKLLYRDRTSYPGWFGKLKLALTTLKITVYYHVK